MAKQIEAVKAVTMKDLAGGLVNEANLSNRQAVDIVKSVFTQIGAHLKKGRKVKLTDFGIMQVRHRAARMGRNPATGEAIKIKASKKISFRPAKGLKQSVM